MSHDALHIRDLVVSHRHQVILSIDTLSVAPGQFVGVIGPNGAGKSTLLRVCLGLQRPTRGSLHVIGHAVTGARHGHLIRLRRQIGYVPQQLPQHAHMPLTVREAIAVGRTGLAGLLRPLSRDDWRIIDEWIDRLGLADLRNRPYGTLSGGEQRKAMIARAMVQQPQVLMLDEPTAYLDLRWREHIVALLDDLFASTSVTVLLVCHELEALPPCCSRLVVLQQGRILADGHPGDVLTPDMATVLYGPGLRVRADGERFLTVPAGGTPQ